MTHINTSNIQIPPDSTGKRVGTFKRTSLYYDNLQPGQQFFVGDTITTTGGSAVITGVNVAGFSAGTGQLFLTQVTGSFTDNEQINIGATYTADVNTSIGDAEGVTEIYYQSMTMVDSNNPEFRASFTDQNFLRVTPPVVTADHQGYQIGINSVPAFTFNFDYVTDATDPEFVSEQIKIKYQNGVNVGSGFSVGDVVRGDTSGAYGIVQSTDTSNSILYLTDVVNAALQSFQAGETIRNMSILTEESAVITSAGSVAANEITRSVELSTGGTVAGCGSTLTSQFYIPLTRGDDTEVQFAVNQTSATPGVTRRFGLFTEDNGYFWEILEANGTNTNFDSSGGEDTAGQTIVCVAHRSNSSGSVVTNFIPQSQFNVNQLDGSDNQGFTLDFTKTNVYWMTIPNNGVGKARFGVFNDAGEKIIAHEFIFYNDGSINQNPVSAFPFRAEVLNNGAGTTGQETKLRINKIGVFQQSFDGDLPQFEHANAQRDVRHIDSTAGEVPIMGVQSRHTRGPTSIDNRAFTNLKNVSLSNLDARIDREFDAATDVNAGTDEITMVNHGLVAGTPVYYQANNNTALSGLMDYGIYYAVAVDDNTIKLASNYINSVVNSSGINIAAGSGNHKIVGLADGAALVRLRKNSQVADAVWTPHNANLSGTEWSDGMTGFRIGEVVTVGAGGTGYAVGDIIEVSGGIKNHREAVLEVCETGVAGAISRVRIAPTSEGHGLEADGTSNANFGSYNGKFPGATVIHKASGDGFSNTTGSSAVFVASVAWGHGWWWRTHYGPWSEWDFADKVDDTDIAFVSPHYQNSKQNQVLTIELQNTEKKSINIATNVSWREHI
jgi:hypothetical protein